MFTWASLLCVLGVSSILSIFIGAFKRKGDSSSGNQLSEYLFGGKSLGTNSLLQLLLSTSFSLNGMLYQVWLGYTLGLWALVIQAAWAISFFFVANKIPELIKSDGLHAYLGLKFGSQTQLVASVCSIIGTTLLIGWEFNVGKSTFQGLVTDNPTNNESIFFTLIIVFICFIYTAIGGLRTNAIANTFQNIFKGVIFLVLIIMLIVIANGVSGFNLNQSLLPSFDKVIQDIGVFGLITNILFSLVWQFVDLTTWQNINGTTKELGIKEIKITTIKSGIATFVAPGIIGTLIGVFLTYYGDLNQDNIMSVTINIVSESSVWIKYALVAALFFCMMSTLDGLMLATAYTFVCDIFYRKYKISDLEKDPNKTNNIMILVRLALLLFSFIGTLGVMYINLGLGISLFDLTYIMIVSQLTLAGPVLIAMYFKTHITDKMKYSIIIAMVIGLLSIFASKYFQNELFLTLGGAITLFVSIISSFIILGVTKK